MSSAPRGAATRVARLGCDVDYGSCVVSNSIRGCSLHVCPPLRSTRPPSNRYGFFETIMVIPCGSNSRGGHGALMRLSAGTSPDDFIDQIKNHRCNPSRIRHRTIDKSRWNGHRCLSARSGSHLVRSSVLRAEHTLGLLNP